MLAEGCPSRDNPFDANEFDGGMYGQRSKMSTASEEPPEEKLVEEPVEDEEPEENVLESSKTGAPSKTAASATEAKGSAKTAASATEAKGSAKTANTKKYQTAGAKSAPREKTVVKNSVAVAASYEAQEELPPSTTAASLLQNAAYRTGKQLGLAAAAVVPPETVVIIDFQLLGADGTFQILETAGGSAFFPRVISPSSIFPVSSCNASRTHLLHIFCLHVK